MATRRDFTTDGDDQYLLSPDCAAGKCSACTGDAWDNRGDRLDTCDHHCHQRAISHHVPTAAIWPTRDILTRHVS